MTDYLLAEPSFIQGIASIGNIEGSIVCNSSENERIADSKAIYSDWLITGEDIRKAIIGYEQEQENED